MDRNCQFSAPGCPGTPCFPIPSTVRWQKAAIAINQLLVQIAVLLTAEEPHQAPVLSFFSSEMYAAIGLRLLWPCKPNLSLGSYSRPRCKCSDLSGQDTPVHTAVGQ